MKLIYLIFILSFIFIQASAQELFPNTEPASNCPKGVLTIRQINEFFTEYTPSHDTSRTRSMNGLMIMYGVSSKLMLTLTATASNHHGSVLYESDKFIKEKDGIIDTHGVAYGNDYPYRFNGFDLKAKYKFINNDGERRHFRMAAYGEVSTCRVPHDEAEPDLMDDNAGIAGGLIATQLIKRLAISATLGCIIPYYYRQNWYQDLGEMKLYYGNAVNYSLSFGYLLFPAKYKNYKQVNVNIYLEFLGEDYQAVKIYLSNIQNANSPIYLDPGSLALQAGRYLEARPGIQFIFNSNTRIDLSLATTIPDGYGGYLLGHSYTRMYPAYFINFQHYFFLK